MVLISGDKVTAVNIFKPNSKDERFEFIAEQIFIGNSPKSAITEEVDAFGPDYDGNSFLLYLSGLKYVFIGDCIYSFTSYDMIETYISNVGNNDVPYPYAIDKSGNIYLMIENIVLMNGVSRMKQAKKNDKFKDSKDFIYKYLDPYAFYYTDHSLIGFKGIDDFLIGEESYNLTYSTNASDDYNRFLTFDDYDSEFGIRIVMNGEEEKLSKNKYIELMHDFAKEHSIKKIKNKTMIRQRLF